MKIPLLLILVILLFNPPIFSKDNSYIFSLKEAHDYVYSRSNKYNWYKNKPPYCKIVKGGYLDISDEDAEEGNFYGFGVISGEAWDKLGLQEDRLYKEGQTFVIERNICLFPNYRLGAGLDWPRYKHRLFDKSRDAKDAKIVRIREAVSSQGNYSFEVLEVISKNPPLEQIFYCD